MNAVLGTIDYGQATVISPIHPPVIKTMKAKANNGTLAMGLLAAKDSNGDLVAYVPAGAAPLNACVGVVASAIDTVSDDAAMVLRHGTVVRDLLKVGGAQADAAAIAALETLGIFAV